MLSLSASNPIKRIRLDDMTNVGSRMEISESFIFSQSSLQDYVDCPQRFQLRHIIHMAWPAIESEPVLDFERHQQEGQQFHRMAQQALIGLPVDQVVPPAGSKDLNQWWESFGSLLQDLLASKTEDGSALYPELTLSAPIGGQRLMAKFDLLVVHHDRAIIYDWKTNNMRPKDERMAGCLQTKVYRYLLAAAGSRLHRNHSLPVEQIEMIYWFSNFPDQPVHLPYSSIQYQRDRSALEKLIGEITSCSDFPLTEDEKRCLFCCYRSYCARGVRAGNWSEAESIDEDDLSDFSINLEQIGEIEF